jgi:hypothetical protein
MGKKYLKRNRTRKRRRTQKAGNPYRDFLAANTNKPPKPTPPINNGDKYKNFINKKQQSQKKRKFDTYTRGY